MYTIAFAYAGAALPTLIIVMLYDRPLGEALTSAELSEEVIRTLVGSIGLVLAIPVTTLIAVLVVKATGIRTGGQGSISPDDVDDTGALAAAAAVAGSERPAAVASGAAPLAETRRGRREAQQLRAGE